MNMLPKSIVSFSYAVQCTFVRIFDVWNSDDLTRICPGSCLTWHSWRKLPNSEVWTRICMRSRFPSWIGSSSVPQDMTYYMTITSQHHWQKHKCFGLNIATKTAQTIDWWCSLGKKTYCSAMLIVSNPWWNIMPRYTGFVMFDTLSGGVVPKGCDISVQACLWLRENLFQQQWLLELLDLASHCFPHLRVSHWALGPRALGHVLTSFPYFMYLWYCEYLTNQTYNLYIILLGFVLVLAWYSIL